LLSRWGNFVTKITANNFGKPKTLAEFSGFQRPLANNFQWNRTCAARSRIATQRYLHILGTSRDPPSEVGALLILPLTMPTKHSVSQLEAVLGHDFCPWANRYVYWLKHPLAVLCMAALVSLLIGTMHVPQGYVVAGGLAGVIGLGLIWPWLAMRGIRGSLRFSSRRGREGETVEATLSVTNRMPWPVWGLVLEQGFLSPRHGAERDDNMPEEVAVALARVPAWSCSDFRFEFVPACRGDYPAIVPQLSTAFPFGLWKQSLEVTIESRVLIWPRTVPLEEHPIKAGSAWSLGALCERRTGMEGDVLGTRPYRSGDSLRFVHWAQTARHDRFIVCERQAALTAKVELRLDLDPRHHCELVGQNSAEQLIRVAASIALSFLEHDVPVVVHTANETERATGGPAGQRLLDWFARLPLARGPLSTRSPEQKQRRDVLLSFLITTDLAIDNFGGFARPAGDGKTVALLTCPEQSAEVTNGAWLAIDATQPLTELKIKWDEICRYGWCQAQ
jgi:uncharacterized protein (DUF58 family)